MQELDTKEGFFLLINKPLTWTSFQLVNKIKYIAKHDFGFKKLKIGHAGTLDPLATGLLIVCVGKFTKRIEEFQKQEKEYTGTFVLGATTPCFDLEKPIDEYYPTQHITREMIENAARSFEGDIMQVPPIFSAVKVDGKRAYDLARKDKTPKLAPKPITIHQFEITRCELPEVDFRIVCSKGTYIRAIARDFGKALQSGAYLSRLCRTRIGNFSLTDAIEIDQIKEHWLMKNENESL